MIIRRNLLKGFARVCAECTDDVQGVCILPQANSYAAFRGFNAWGVEGFTRGCTAGARPLWVRDRETTVIEPIESKEGSMGKRAAGSRSIHRD